MVGYLHVMFSSVDFTLSAKTHFDMPWSESILKVTRVPSVNGLVRHHIYGLDIMMF